MELIEACFLTSIVISEMTQSKIFPACNIQTINCPLTEDIYSFSS